MSSIYHYTTNVYHTKPDDSELSPGDIVLTKREPDIYIDYEEREVCSTHGTYYIRVPVEKTRYITIYYVVSADSYQRMLTDYPLE